MFLKSWESYQKHDKRQEKNYKRNQYERPHCCYTCMWYRSKNKYEGICIDDDEYLKVEPNMVCDYWTASQFDSPVSVDYLKYRK